MISFKKFIMPSVLGVAAAATLGDVLSLVDGIPFLESLVDPWVALYDHIALKATVAHIVLLCESRKLHGNIELLAFLG